MNFNFRFFEFPFVSLPIYLCLRHVMNRMCQLSVLLAIYLSTYSYSVLFSFFLSYLTFIFFNASQLFRSIILIVRTSKSFVFWQFFYFIFSSFVLWAFFILSIVFCFRFNYSFFFLLLNFLSFILLLSNTIFCIFENFYLNSWFDCCYQLI